MKGRVLLTLGIAASLAVVPGHSQVATPEQMAGVPPNPGYGTLHLSARLGSFRLLDGVGRVEVTFTGTLLLTKLKGIEGGPGSVTITGDVRKEFEDHERTAYFGTGKAVVVGRFRGIQWFGRNMRAVWYGAGVARLAGEFDQNLETGWYWYRDPSRRQAWLATGVFEVRLPDPFDLGDVTPRPVPMQPRNGG